MLWNALKIAFTVKNGRTKNDKKCERTQIDAKDLIVLIHIYCLQVFFLFGWFVAAAAAVALRLCVYVVVFSCFSLQCVFNLCVSVLCLKEIDFNRYKIISYEFVLLILFVCLFLSLYK